MIPVIKVVTHCISDEEESSLNNSRNNTSEGVRVVGGGWGPVAGCSGSEIVAASGAESGLAGA